MVAMFDDIPHPHATRLRRLLEEIGDDDRFDALLAGGSLVQGTLDEHSDLDLVLVVGDHARIRPESEGRAFAERIGPLLAAFTGEHVGEPRLLICLYGPPLLHVDLKFVRLGESTRLVERPLILWARDPETVARVLDRAEIRWPERSPQWFEDRAWIWLHYAATKLHRGELFEALGMIAFFCDQILGPMLHRRAGRPQRGVRRIETDASAAEMLRSVVATHDRGSIATALANAADLYLRLRTDDPPASQTPTMPQSFRSFLTSR
jgi:hypothetical protein